VVATAEEAARHRGSCRRWQVVGAEVVASAGEPLGVEVVAFASEPLGAEVAAAAGEPSVQRWSLLLVSRSELATHATLLVWR
jgi:hypothetical protein